MRFQILFIGILFFSCARKKQSADLILHNGVIYTVDSAFTVATAMAIKDGSVLAAGTEDEILDRFLSDSVIDLKGNPVFPGFIDAHCHFLSYGLGLSKVDLIGTTSWEEVIRRVAASSKRTLPNVETERPISAPSDEWIVGRGWDQNDWGDKTMPTNRALDSLFPSRPVMLTRIDGHAAMANTHALKLAGITAKTRLTGGEVVILNGKPTGLLIDNAIDLVRTVMPEVNNQKKNEALLLAQTNCLEAGITTVSDAGLMAGEVNLIDQLQQEKKLYMRVYAMLSDSAPNYDAFLSRGPLVTPMLNVRAFKFYGDGALGSRGACLLSEYADQENWLGFLLNTPAHYRSRAKQLMTAGFQMATHCIGDSAYRLMLTIYREAGARKEHRWRVEHAQITHPDDITASGDIVPSVQPTHATSDMYWAADRLGNERVKYAYAYKQLLKSAGLLALGTDFPVEDISPFKTFYAAVTRRDSKGFPPGGFNMHDALSRGEALRGMTIWAAYANFEDQIKGSLEKGKVADFVILDHDIMKGELSAVLNTKVLATYIGGKARYVRE